MMAFLLTLKAKLAAIGLALLAFAGLILRGRYLSAKADKAQHRADRAEATILYKDRVDAADSELEQTFSHRADVAKEAAKEGKVPPNLSNPNDF